MCLIVFAWRPDHAQPLIVAANRDEFYARPSLPLAQWSETPQVHAGRDLSEQISLAGMEASGTGNMKFALNGALTVGTEDGANVEIRRLVGDDNFFLFGMLEPEVASLQSAGYQPGRYYEENPDLKGAIDLIASGAFSDGDRNAFEPVVSNLLYQDRFMALADYQSYLDAQVGIEKAYLNKEAWTKSAILNVARSGFFSSDRSMRDYLSRIWGATPDK